MNALEKRRAIMEASATLGAQKIQSIIAEGEEANALRASIFAIEQMDGKATQVTETKSTGITLHVDLSGSGQLTEALGAGEMSSPLKVIDKDTNK